MGKNKTLVLGDDGTVAFYFRDDATGANGKLDPGANHVVGQIPGSGRAALHLSKHFFNLLAMHGVSHHALNFDLKAEVMRAKQLTMLPVEFIWRDEAAGSFCRTYGTEKGFKLDGLIELTMKNDALEDPRINKEAACKIGLLTAKQYDYCAAIIRKVGGILWEYLADKFGLKLIDFKLEFGVDTDGKVLLADEISGNIMRVEKDGKSVGPVELAQLICPECYQEVG